jgi:SprT protein
MSLYEQVRKKVKNALAIAKNKLGVELPMPTIIYDLKGHVAGYAFYSKNKIRLNKHLLEKYKEDFINRTVLHELGHLISYKKHGYSGRGHKANWKAVMIAIGGPTSRCHSYETKAARVHKKYVLSCGDCRETYVVGSRVINKIRKGSTYTHRNCPDGSGELIEIK